MTFDTTFLRSKVARRVFALFILCALLPVTALALISFTHVSKQLNEQSQKRLRQASKSVGMSIYERLLFLDAELKLLGSRLEAQSVSAVRSLVEARGNDLKRGFVALAAVGEKTHVTLLGRVREVPELSTADTRHLNRGETVVRTASQVGERARVFMARLIDQKDRAGGMLLAEVNIDYLWGIDDASILPALTQMCVVEKPQAVLICSLDAMASISLEVTSPISNSPAKHFEWRHADDEYVGSFWAIPLRHRFSSPAWTVVLAEPQAVALAPMAEFRTTFPWIVLLSVWVVSLLSLVQIRRSLDPVQKLKEGTRRIASRDFESRVTISTGDEFGELGDSFNAMAAQLGRQFHTLASISEIDRAVLSSLDVGTLVETVLARVRDVFPCEVVSVTLRDAGANRLARTYLKVNNPRAETVVEHVELTLTGLQALHENPDHLLIPDGEIPDFLAPLGKRGAGAFLVLPLFRSQHPSGFIALGYTKPPSYSEEDLVQARQLADQVAAALANAEDLAERKRAEALVRESNQQLEAALTELKSTQKQMIQQERLRALGQMASGIAHDFNNTLSPILGFSELLLMNPKNLEKKDELEERLRLIHTAARDATKVVARLREFYRPRERVDEAGSVDLNTLAEQAVRLTQPKWRDQALASGITVSIETDLQVVPPIVGNETELREVLTNLIFNAVDALTKSGTITLRTRADGPYVFLQVADTGAGMTEEVRQRCLEPFFSTKGDRGSGLGLSMVYGIIHRHEGTIDIESQPEKGTTFIIRLPARQGSEVKAEEVRGEDICTALHVLVVDDDPIVCRVTTEYLTSVGYTFETAGGGEEALRKFEQHRFDLVMTDQGMPEMSGEQLASLIKERSPKTPVMLLTGAGKLPQAGDQGYASVDFLLHKPLTMAELKYALAQLKAKQEAAQPEPVGDRT